VCTTTGVVRCHPCVLRRNCIVADSVKVRRLLKRLSLFVLISVPKESLSERADLKLVCNATLDSKTLLYCLEVDTCE